ncbi:MAG TPA: hypothetical protein VIY53_09600 [Acidobacteriaceae bacterium]
MSDRSEAPHNAGREPASTGSKPPDVPEETTSPNASVRARIARPHKGDVGRPGTNEEIYQGSKVTELR